MDSAELKRIYNLVETIKPLLAGQGPEVQGAALADLTAIWLAGMPPELRTRVWELQKQTVQLLIGPNEELARIKRN